MVVALLETRAIFWLIAAFLFLLIFQLYAVNAHFLLGLRNIACKSKHVVVAVVFEVVVVVVLEAAVAVFLSTFIFDLLV